MLIDLSWSSNYFGLGRRLNYPKTKYSKTKNVQKKGFLHRVSKFPREYIIDKENLHVMVIYSKVLILLWNFVSAFSLAWV